MISPYHIFYDKLLRFLLFDPDLQKCMPGLGTAGGKGLSGGLFGMVTDGIQTILKELQPPFITKSGCR